MRQCSSSLNSLEPQVLSQSNPQYFLTQRVEFGKWGVHIRLPNAASLKHRSTAGSN